jgi:hypothetical protein
MPPNPNPHLLVKKQDIPRTASNTRPIALSNIMRRIFEKSLLKNWMELNESETTSCLSETTSWMNLDPGQAGFRRGYSTLSQIILSDELSRHSNPFSIFLDIKGAFDNVNWSKLDSLLISRKCPPSHRNLILSLMCKPAQLQLSVNQSERIPIHTHKGVFQGGGISAFIFSIYIDPLAQQLNANSPPHCPLGLLYADDIQIKPGNIESAQSALDLCTTYGIEYDMIWSISKCAVVGSCDTELTLSGHILPNANEYKYLGMIHRKNGIDFKLTFETAANKQTCLLSALSNYNWHPKIRLIIYRTFIRPISEYSAALAWIWAKKDQSSRSSVIRIMERNHKKAINWIFYQRQHLKILDYISGLGPYTYRIECLRAGLARSLSKLSPTNPQLAVKSVYFISTSKNFILTDCFQSSYWSSYKLANRSKKVAWATHMKNEFKRLLYDASKLYPTIAYYSPSLCASRISPIFHLPRDEFHTVLKWRTNRSLPHRSCICGTAFNRSHVECILELNPIFNAILSTSRYKNSCNQMLSLSTARHYCPLDFILNTGDHQTFLSLINVIQARLDLG